MDQESEPNKPTLRPPDLSGPPELSKPVLSGPAGTPPPDLKAPDLGPPPPSIPSPSIPAPSIPVPSAPEPSFAPPPTVAIPEEAKKKPKEMLPDPDEVKAGDIAPFNTRLIAALIDWAVVFCLYVVFSLFHSALGSLASLAGLGYILTKDSLPFLNGQSIGKRVMKLRAVSADGAPLTGNWEKGILRNAFLLIAVVELVVLLLREDKPEKGRRLGDDFAKTKVIVEADPEAPAA